MSKATCSAPKRQIAWGRYLLVFFIAAWMFILGLLVGRGTAPVTFDTQALQKELAALRTTMLKKERAAVEKIIRGENPEAPLEFYEALKKDGTDTVVQMPPEAVPTVSSPTTTSSPATGSTSPPHKTKGSLMAKNGTATPPPVAARRPPPAASTGRLTIQVAALKDARAAGQILADLKKKGYAAYVSKKAVPGKGIWYRVRVGSYKNRKQALGDLGRLTRDHRQPIIVSR